VLAARSPSRTLKEIELIETAGGPLGAELSLQIVEAANERLAPEGSLLLYTGAAIVDGLDPFESEVEKRLAKFGSGVLLPRN